MNRASFALLFGVIGAVAAVSQVLFMRQALIAAGGFEPVLALTLAGWLFGVFLGAGLFGLLRPTPHLWRGWWTFLPLIWAVVLGLCLAYSYFLFPQGPGGSPPIVPLAGLIFSLTLLTAPPGFFMGGLSVLAWTYLSRSQIGMTPPVPSAPWIVSFIEAFGAALGLLLLTLLMAVGAAPTEILAAACGLMILGQATALPRRTATRLLLISVVFLVAVGVHFSGGLGWLDQIAQARRLSMLNPEAKKPVFRESPYQYLSLAEQNGRPILYRDQILDCDRPGPAGANLYARFFLAQAGQRDRVLLVGCGLPDFIQALLQAGTEKLTVVPLDAGEADFLKQNLPEKQAGILKNPRLELVPEDVRLFLNREADPAFDLIVVLAAHPTNAFVNRVHTREFLAEAKKRLTPRGLLVTGLSGDESYWNPDPACLGPLLLADLKRLFPQTLILSGPVHFFLAPAAPDLLALDDETLIARYRKLGFSPPLLTPMFLTKSSDFWLNQDHLVRKIDQMEANTDLKPATYLAGLAWWQQVPKAERTRVVLGTLRRTGCWGPWAAVLALIPALTLLIWPGRDRVMGWTSIVTGLVSTGLLVVLLFHFQNRYGTLFGALSLLLFLYSTGLAAGCFLGWLGAAVNLTSRGLLFFVSLLAAGLAGAIALTAAGGFGGHFYLLPPGLGLLAGLEAGLSLAVRPGQRPAAEAVGSLAALRTWHALGSVIGLLLVGLILVASVGPARACWVLAGLKLVYALPLLRLRPVRLTG